MLLPNELFQRTRPDAARERRSGDGLGFHLRVGGEVLHMPRIRDASLFSNCLTARRAARILFLQAKAAMKRILVPVDFSPAMEGILTHAREMARALGAELHLVHVREIAAVPVFPAATIGYPGIGMPEMGMTGGRPGGGPRFLPL